MDLNKQKIKFIDSIIKKETTSDDIIILWNKMCNSNYNPLLNNAHISHMNSIDVFNFWSFTSNVEKEQFNVSDNYYALNYNNKIISFNDINFYYRFNSITLRNYLIETNWGPLKKYNNDLIDIFINNISSENKDKSKMFIETLIENNIIQIYNIDWNNLYKTIENFFSKYLEIKY